MTDQDQKNSNEVEEEVQTEDSQEEVNSELNNLTYEELLEEVDKKKEETLRAVAELENYRRRTSNELTNALKYANSELLLAIIPIITSLEKATTDLEDAEKIDKEGVLLILDSFEKTLENFNIVPINPSGQEFDPEKHEAVSTVNNPGEKDNFVTNTLERGWTLNERVVKPALVVVNKK
ncbi:MAG: nucleotide exchange factor GrpE [Gammaproteobacteria bacterium]|nr:nucleotide exchange factor GrpE [Gammaproteobacteria bacterium]|tara:strand:+ start:1252 stop:1788 length:537 start_codon:yes stop_codon:yes gene_type:complete